PPDAVGLGLGRRANTSSFAPPSAPIPPAVPPNTSASRTGPMASPSKPVLTCPPLRCCGDCCVPRNGLRCCGVWRAAGRCCGGGGVAVGVLGPIGLTGGGVGACRVGCCRCCGGCC